MSYPMGYSFTADWTSTFQTSVSQIVPVSLVASLSFDLNMPPASTPGFEGQTLFPSASS